jgi:hypothetical protein
MTRFWRETAWLWVFALATACGGNSSDLFEDDGASGDGSEETGGLSSGGDGSSGDEGVGGSGAVNTGGKASVTGGAPPAGGKIGAGGTSAGGAIGVGGTSSAGAIGVGGTGTAGAIGTGGTFGGMIGVGGAIIGGKTSVGGASPGGSAGAGGGSSECVDPDGADYKKRGTAKGSNGSFEDHCDGGDLIEYVCETGVRPCPLDASSGAADTAAPARPLPQGGGSGIVIPPQCMGPTGRVTETRIACGGRCDAGTCFGWCPGAGDELTYQDVAGAEVVIDNDTKDARYRCEATASTGDADCTDPALEGETVEVDSLVSCSAAVISFVARLSAEATCSYRCSLVD